MLIVCSIAVVTYHKTTVTPLFCKDSDPLSCQTDADCLCTEVNGCFMGNKDYYNRCEDKSIGCDDFCAGRGQKAVKCIENKCSIMYKQIIYNNFRP